MSSSETSPIHGFTEDLEVSTGTRKRTRGAETDNCAQQYGRIQTRSRSATGRLNQPPKNKESVESYWDDYLSHNTQLVGNRGSPTSCSTHFDVTVIDNQVDRHLSESSNCSEVFLSPGSELALSEDEENHETSQSDYNSDQTPSINTIMAGFDIHYEAIEEAKMIWEDDFETIVFEQTTLDYLQQKVSAADQMKAKVQKAILTLKNKDAENFSTGLQDACTLKNNFVGFIKDAQAYIKRENDKEKSINTSNFAALNASRAIKVDKVNAFAPGVVTSLKEIVKEFSSFKLPENDSQFRQVEDKHSGTCRRGAEVLKEAKELCKDAVDAGLREITMELEKVIHDYQTARAEIDSSLLDQKVTFGIVTHTSGLHSRLLEVKPPEFSGDLDGLDYYSFRKDFEEYIGTKPYSNSEIIMIMTHTCLKGSAKRACINMTDLHTIWRFLEETYGNVKILFSHKIDEIKSLGTCTGSNCKKREWALNIKSHLIYLQNLATKFNIMDQLYHSQVIQEIQLMLPTKLQDKYKEKLQERNCMLTREIIYLDLVSFMDDVIKNYTFEVDYALSLSTATSLSEVGKSKSTDSQKSQKTPFQSSNRKSHNVSQQHIQKSAHTVATKPRDLKCCICNKKHTLMMYCEDFQKANPHERYKMLGIVKACFRCLRLDSEFDANDRPAWWRLHEPHCTSDFSCEVGNCGSRPKNTQIHMLVCNRHTKKNEERVDEFIKTLDKNLISPNTKFFYNAPAFVGATSDSQNTSQTTPDLAKIGGKVVLPDIEYPACFMMQNIKVDKDKNLLVFYDNGCSAAVLSDRAYGMMETKTVRPGPTPLDVAGGQTIMLEGGDERFWLELEGGDKLATITGLRMPKVTCKFPVIKLTAAWEEVQSAYRKTKFAKNPLPTIDKEIGGKAVDILLGMRYIKYFPRHIFSLPGGLGIYRAQFKSANGNQAVLGGPHQSWLVASERAHQLSPRMYFTCEMRAYFAQDFALRNFVSPKAVEYKNFSEVSENPDEDPLVICNQIHCLKHRTESGWTVPLHWNLDYTQESVRADERRFRDVEDIGSEIQYRCVRCRNCADCRNADTLEKVSLVEEVEQAMIEDSVRLDTENKKLIAKLPFLKDPSVELKPNKHVAEKVLQSQLRIINKTEGMKEDVINSHNKLRLRGFVIPVSDLPKYDLDILQSYPFMDHFIPWRTVTKEGSLSTPTRMVFDASARTPGGSSLNSILPKGQNKLSNLFQILLRFRSGKSAFTGDVRMAYNNIWLEPEFLKFQKYLWKEDLNPDNPTIEMVIRTLIYGVRPSGNQTLAGFSTLAKHCIDTYPEHQEGADVLLKDTYMDDIMSSAEDDDASRKIAGDVEFVLGRGSMEVKAFTFSGAPPDESVSPDGVTVGLVGYLWEPEADIIRLDIKELYLGKIKRGKRPEVITGSIGDALKPRFTKRIIAGKVASVYDPLGLAVPITSKFKLDFSEICRLNVDWDDHIPNEYLDAWVRNLTTIQSLKEVYFRRSVIPPDAASTDIELITSADASQHIAVACVHSRIKLRTGSYYVQLVCAKSKIVSNSTIPRAELRAATLAATLCHTYKVNLGKFYFDAIYITDSSITLFWIHQDQRPLQVAIRNCVIEIRRLSLPEKWFHVDSANNVADLGTRDADVKDIQFGSDWQCGKSWMRCPIEEMPIQSIEELTLSGEEKRLAAQELKSPDIQGITIMAAIPKLSDRYNHSKYLVDPCRLPWPKSVRAVAACFKFIANLKRCIRNPGKRVKELSPKPWVITFTDEEIKEAEDYFFRKATKEVMTFSNPKDYKDCSSLKDGILYFNGRILEGQEINCVEHTMTDLQPLSFAKPMVDRHSPIGYSIMSYAHQVTARHRSAVTTLRVSREIAYILHGRNLALEVYQSCNSCRRYKARRVKVEMGKIHDTRLTIAPAFYHSQVDLFGPYLAICEHNHRSTVKVWGVIFKDPASGAISVHAMQSYSTAAFMQAYTRFSSIRGHPAWLYIDEGSQLVKGCKSIEFSWADITNSLNANHQVGISYQTCPVGGHNFHGIVERSVKEVKRLFNLVYDGLRLDILSYETAFAWTANELNNLPIALGSRYANLECLDLISPNRLLLGRNNHRSPVGFSRVETPSKLIKQMDLVVESWWKVWLNEKIEDYVPQPPKWLNSSTSPEVNDIIIFLGEEPDKTLGDPVWKIGRVKEVVKGKDQKIRTVIIEYKNSTESVFRTTRRSVRKCAILHHEGDLDLVEELNVAAKAANVNLILKSKVGTGLV